MNTRFFIKLVGFGIALGLGYILMVQSDAKVPQGTASPFGYEVYVASMFAPGFTLTPIPTPNPLARECDNLEQHPERSLLKNGSFEEGFDGDVPSGWKQFSTPGASTDIEEGYEKFGAASLKILGAESFRTGISQKVGGLSVNRWYHAFYATAQIVWGGQYGARDGALPILRQVGVDTSGGTDPDAKSVIWGRTSGGQSDRHNNTYGGWKTLGNENNPLVSFVATGPTATVFIRAVGWPDVTRSITWIDSAYLAKACQYGYRH